MVDFLAEIARISKRKAKTLIDSRQIRVNGRRVWIAHHILLMGDEVSSPDHTASTSPPHPAIRLVQTQGLNIYNKPPNLLSTGKGSLEMKLQVDTPGIEAAHRLDKDTSGCLLFITDPAIKDATLDAFKNRSVRKVYLAIAYGFVKTSPFLINTPIEGKQAESRIHSRRSTKRASLLEVEITTGRTHQIRKHLQHIGHPVLGDRVYDNPELNAPAYRKVPRQMLHASKLELKHPVTGKKIEGHASIPEDFRATLRQFGLPEPD